jgi:exosome complex component RRP46
MATITAVNTTAALRPLSCELSTLHNCDGSAEWKSGNTDVLAAVHGPIAPRINQHERADRCSVSVSIKRADGAVPDWEIFVQRVLASCIRTQQYPRCVISVTLQVLHADGSELAALIHAAVSALLDASIDLTVLPVAVTVHPSSMRLDPSSRDIGGGDTNVVVFVFAGSTGAGGADSTTQILACTGLFGDATALPVGAGGVSGWLECCQRAERAVPAIRGFWRLVMEQKMDREANTLWAQS